MIYIGIDNGVTGAIAIITEDNKIVYFKMPTIKTIDYTKKIHTITRIDTKCLIEKLNSIDGVKDNSMAYIERPMVNPMRFVATKSALRSLEAVLISLEYIGIPYKFVDSKEWQRKLLPQGIKKEQLKFASIDVVRQRFNIDVGKDSNLSDAILIAQFCRID